ncbi:hypothetical protein TNCV_2306301 [Trichonephila clavipes]|nr:hypothetical protein TNCV_2306301 [Trichonephila clavipes]
MRKTFSKQIQKKFKTNFEGTYRVLEVTQNNLVIWRPGKKLKVNVNQVRIDHHRKVSGSFWIAIRKQKDCNGDQMSHMVGRNGVKHKKKGIRLKKVQGERHTGDGCGLCFTFSCGNGIPIPSATLIESN